MVMMPSLNLTFGLKALYVSLLRRKGLLYTSNWRRSLPGPFILFSCVTIDIFPKKNGEIAAGSEYLRLHFSNISSIKTINDLDSDHLPILLKLETNKNIDTPGQQIYQYQKADWTKFKEHLNINIKETLKSKQTKT